jgi:cell division septal protein FtsQ
MPTPKTPQPQKEKRPAPNKQGAAGRRPAGRKAAPARKALHSTSESVAAQVIQLRAAIGRGRPTKRVGWGLFQDDIRRGRLLSLAGLAILVAIGLSMATSPDYVVAGVTVRGSATLTAAEATRLAGVDGMNIFLVDPQAVAARLSESAFLKNVAVETALPNQVIIHVEERRPRVVWVLKDRTPYLVSEDGILMSQATTLDGYVVVYDQETDPGALKIGDGLERDDAIDTAQRLTMLWPASLGLNLALIEWQNSAGGVTVVTDTDQRLQFGDSRQLEEKLRVGATLIADLRARNIAWSRLDLRAPDRPGVFK